MATEEMNNYKIHIGSNLDILPTLADCSVDSIVTDPPYELGFMGKSWDASGIAYSVNLWRECLRVLKPGGHLLAFSGSRTYHRMTCAIEDAGFEIRDQMLWVYGSGFPKSHNISKALEKQGKASEQWEGWGTALKPAHEPICLARKPIEGTVADNVLKWGVGGLNLDACRVGEGTGRFPANLMHDGSQEVLELFPQSNGGAAPKKANDINTLYEGGWKGVNREERIEYGKGSAARFFYCPKASKSDRDEGCEDMEGKTYSMSGNDSDFAGDIGLNKAIHRKNFHPTVKPTELMRYLCRLITPPGGLVLDPFMGSGSTGKAALLEGFSFVGIELSEEYVEIAKRRIAAANA